LDDIVGKVPDGAEVLRVGLRMLAAVFIGGCIGLQRELTHHAAGLRTHILVALGSALLVISGAQSDMSSADLSRIIQGIVTGIGFLGGGAILKLTTEREIRGLTTAAGIWMTATASIAAGLGRIITALIALVLSLLVLGVLIKFEKQELSRASREADSAERSIR
jgi:putative Mg2+ transporter-C (MgtC) family protein